MTIRAPRSSDALARRGGAPLPFPGASPCSFPELHHLPPPPPVLPPGFSPTSLEPSPPSSSQRTAPCLEATQQPAPRSTTVSPPGVLRPPRGADGAPRWLRSVIVGRSPLDEPSCMERDAICASVSAWRRAASSPSFSSASAPVGILRIPSAPRNPARRGLHKTVRFNLPPSSSDSSQGATSTRAAETLCLLHVPRCAWTRRPLLRKRNGQ
jgi:hypothetical protein